MISRIESLIEASVLSIVIRCRVNLDHPSVEPCRYRKMVVRAAQSYLELRYEDSRIDFVAVTRARTDLSILIPQKFSARYVDPDTSETSIISSETTLGEMEKLYSRAYQHFVHGRKEDARRTIKQGGEWLRDSIRSYFQSNFTLSYSIPFAL